jgi:hypothetical protein
MGVDRDRAESYSHRIREGGVLVIAHVHDEWEDRVESIMQRHNPVSVEDVDTSESR